MGAFKKGIFLGGLFGAGLMWLSVTKEGRALRDQGIEHAARVVEQIKKELPKTAAWKKMKKSQFVKIVEKTTEKYAAELGLTRSAATLIIALVSKQWEKIKKDA